MHYCASGTHTLPPPHGCMDGLLGVTDDLVVTCFRHDSPFIPKASIVTIIRYTTVYITPPSADFPRFMVDTSTGGMVPVPKSSALETSRRELSEDVSFGISTLLVVEQSSWEKRPRGW